MPALDLTTIGECPRCGVRFIAERPGVAAAPCAACTHPVPVDHTAQRGQLFNVAAFAAQRGQESLSTD